ncbi:hypothetical protein EV652_108501 [Kribbella steppae]|uniref:Uncharacterized protein n=1 Tax=Kribbella steppae TaxID=2512223 RepID=A0A4R2HDT2_9ACTN|nr:hypothetical protein [Kribbella steppae]TCO24963.1 hypothetical protein EV652_108501 [Kribbella steppae]
MRIARILAAIAALVALTIAATTAPAMADREWIAPDGQDGTHSWFLNR